MSSQYSVNLVNLESLSLNSISSAMIFSPTFQWSLGQERATRSTKRSDSTSRNSILDSQLLWSRTIFTWLAVRDWTSSKTQTTIHLWSVSEVAMSSSKNMSWNRTDTTRECWSFTWSRVARALSGLSSNSLQTGRSPTSLLTCLNSSRLTWWELPREDHPSQTSPSRQALHTERWTCRQVHLDLAPQLAAAPPPWERTLPPTWDLLTLPEDSISEMVVNQSRVKWILREDIVELKIND